MSCHGNPVGILGDWGGRMESTEERRAEEVGCRPAVKVGYCWWTCSGQLWCSDPTHVENLDGPVVQAS